VNRTLALLVFLVCVYMLAREVAGNSEPDPARKSPAAPRPLPPMPPATPLGYIGDFDRPFERPFARFTNKH
jgi:hypothetical protein